MKITIVIASLWVGCGLFTTGAMNADFRGRFPSLYREAAFARHECAEFIGVGAVFGPIGFLMSPFMTGFFQHGWTLTCEPMK